MKKNLLFILLIPGSTLWLFSQNETQQIENIDKITQAIKNNIANYQQTKVIDDSSGYSYSYKKGSELKLIMVLSKEREPGINIDKKVEWYFSNGHLIYAEQKWIDAVSNAIIDSQKTYLDATHIIQWIKSGNQIVERASQEFMNVEEHLLAYGIKLAEKSK